MKYEIKSGQSLTVQLSKAAKDATIEYLNSGSNTIIVGQTDPTGDIESRIVGGETFKARPNASTTSQLIFHTDEGLDSELIVSKVYPDGTRDACDAFGNPDGGASGDDFLKKDGSNFDSSKRVDYQKGINIRDSETTAYLMTDADQQSGAFNENVGLLMFRDSMTNPISQSNREIILGTMLNQPLVSSMPNSTPCMTNMLRIADNNVRTINNPHGTSISGNNYNPLRGNNVHALELLNMALSSYSSYIAGIRLVSGMVAINTIREQDSYNGNHILFHNFGYPQCKTLIGGSNVTIAGPTWFGSSDVLSSGMIRTYWPISFMSRSSGTDAATGTRTSLQVYSKTETNNAIGTALTTTTYDSLTTTAKTIIGAINELKAALPTA